MGMCEGTNSSNRHPLFYEKFDARDWQRAILVVNVDHCPSGLLWRVNILFKCGPHARSTLIDTAPSLDFTEFMLLFVGLELNWLLANSEYLLVLHILVLVESVNDSFYEVLDLCLWALTNIGLLVVDGTGHTNW